MDLNSVHISGRLTADPVGRRSGDGRGIATFRIAVERDREHVDFFKVTCFDRLAQSVLAYLARSSRVIVAGRLAQREQDRVEIIAVDVHFIDGMRKRQDQDRQDQDRQDRHDPHDLHHDGADDERADDPNRRPHGDLEPAEESS